MKIFTLGRMTMNLNFGVIEGFNGDKEIKEYLQGSISNTDPDQAIQDILSCLGEKCLCERTYIFELHDKDTFSNTYEWCAEGIVPQKEMLQNEQVDILEPWWMLFEDNRPVVIKDIEDIKDKHPQIYAGLKPQNIHSLVTAPIWWGEKIIGFLGVDNPSDEKMDDISDLLFLIGNFVSFLIDRRNLMSRLAHLSYYDQMTGAYNRQSYDEFIKESSKYDSVGLVYCDVSDLKGINSRYGFEVGDRLLKEVYDMMKAIFVGDQIFRTGGDEFIAISINSSQKSFEEKIEQLQVIADQKDFHMAVGSSWSDEKPIDFLKEMKTAEKVMYWGKKLYYNQMDPTGQIRDRRRTNLKDEELLEVEKSEFLKFYENNYFDAERFFESVCMPDFFPFVADLESNLFYISDDMRDTFGFKSNMVTDLIVEWEKRIESPDELAAFRESIEDVLSGKIDKHDLRYRIRDRDGNYIWVHCHGLVRRCEETGKAIFFSGAVSRQEQKFVVDPVTNFPREYGAMLRLRELKEKNHEVTIIGFTLNNFSEINELRGRSVADILLRDISKKLTQYFENKLRFFRLDGMRFIGIVSPELNESVEQIILQIKEIITGLYYNNNIVVRTPCSVGVIRESNEKISPQDMIVNMVMLLSSAKHSSETDYVEHSQRNIHEQRQRTQMSMELNRDVVEGFNDFRIVIQPTVSTKDNRMSSGEVLLRWQFEGKDVSPALFIPMLENNRLILPVGKWVFEQAVRACKRTAAYLPDFRLAVNVSYYQILDPEFLPFMEQTLKKYDLNGERLILEITETHYDETPTKVFQFIESCKALGMEVAIDDFGNGYSSLAFLMKYPANIVKLDRSLINEMVNSEDNINFISSIVYACHKFGKKVCAEGVETQKELDIITATGCDMIQGYYFYRPMEISDFFSLLPSVARERLQRNQSMEEQDEVELKILGEV